MAATHARAFGNSRPWAEDEFNALLLNPGCFAIGTPACFALIRVVLDEAELLTIATHPDHQRQGLARKAMAKWHTRAHQHGAARAFLEVAADNHGAIALYRQCGYETAGSRPGYYRRDTAFPVDALMMTRPLP